MVCFSDLPFSALAPPCQELKKTYVTDALGWQVPSPGSFTSMSVDPWEDLHPALL